MSQRLLGYQVLQRSCWSTRVSIDQRILRRGSSLLMAARCQSSQDEEVKCFSRGRVSRVKRLTAARRVLSL